MKASLAYEKKLNYQKAPSMNGQFQLTALNKIWVTKITELKIQASNKKLYLSPIMDLDDALKRLPLSTYSMGEKITEYVSWYNNKRIKEKLNGLSPIKYRQQAA